VARRAFLDLPRWYGPERDPPLPLVISPHGRQAMAQANSARWGNLPAQGVFAVVNPEGQGRVLGNASWGDPGQIADLARMPELLEQALPWLRLDRNRVYAVGGSMGGQEVLLLLARFPDLLRGVVAFDAPTDLALRFQDMEWLHRGAYLRGLMRREVGATPAEAPGLYAARSPLEFVPRIARSDVRLALWWSRRDRVVVDGAAQSGRLYRLIKRFDADAPVREIVGSWPHMAEMNWNAGLPTALRWLRLLPPRRHRSRSGSETAPIGILAVRSSSIDHNSPCNRSMTSPLAYHWPIKPFDRQHPIRGYFGDPRTVSSEELGDDRSGSAGSFTFHNGVDIYAPTGTPVYPVVSGTAHVASGDLVTVTTTDGRTFQYFHVASAVSPGQAVIAYRTVLGWVRGRWQHVHLTEIDDFRVHNPLDPGHLEPYRDRTVPETTELRFDAADGAALAANNLHGSIQIAADIADAQPIPVPGHWLDFPVAPALVRWRLASRAKTVIHNTTVADFRHVEPGNQDFWHVYAAGTYQNFPDFQHHLYFHRPGHYLFNLTQVPLDTRRLANGVYRVSVIAADTCGNRSVLTQSVTIHNSPLGKRPPA
jgi:pimeloyl-ACP methyl ester carboxylesterase